MYKELFKNYNVVRLKDESWSHLPQFLSIFSQSDNLELYVSDSLEEEKEEKKVKFNPEDLDTDLETKGIVMSLDDFSNSFKIFRYLLRHMPKLKSIVLSN